MFVWIHIFFLLGWLFVKKLQNDKGDRIYVYYFWTFHSRGINNVYFWVHYVLGGFGHMLMETDKDGRTFSKFIGLFIFVNCWLNKKYLFVSTTVSLHLLHYSNYCFSTGDTVLDFLIMWELYILEVTKSQSTIQILT